MTQTVGDTDPISLGTVFQVSSNVTTTAVRFYFGAGWDALGKPGTVAIYNNGTGALLASAPYSGTPSTGWNDVALSQALTTGLGYIAVVYYPTGRYPAEGSYYDDHDPSNGPLTLAPGGSNGKYNYATGVSWPTNSFNFSSYFADVLVSTGGTEAALTPATETDAAVALRASKAKVLGASAEVDQAQALGHTKHAGLSPATSTDSAQSLRVDKRRAIVAAVEVDVAASLGLAKHRTIVPVVSTEAAQPLSWLHAHLRTLSPATESDAAVALSVTGGRRRLVGTLGIASYATLEVT